MLQLFTEPAGNPGPAGDAQKPVEKYKPEAQLAAKKLHQQFSDKKDLGSHGIGADQQQD